MEIEEFKGSLKGDTKKALSDFDKYIAYWIKQKNGALPDRLCVTSVVMEEMRNCAIAYCEKTHKQFNGILTWEGVKVVQINKED